MTTTAEAALTRQADYPGISLYIDGEWVQGSGGRGDDIVNPATEDVLGRVPFAEPGDVERAIAGGRGAFGKWRDAGPDFRSGILLRASALLHQRADTIGRVMTLEEGKPLKEAIGEVHRAATLLQWDCEEGRRAYGRIIPSDPSEVLSVRMTPVGPVGAFVPWNFPAGGPMRKIAAALSAGCSIVIKPSEEVPGTVTLIARAFEDAGLPPGVLNLLFGVPDEISRRVIADPAIRFVAFTGSVSVGKHIAGLAAASMKPAVMELGGHAPVIVCADTDPVAAARAAVRAKLANAGQVCTSPSRFLVDRKILAAFTDAFTDTIKAIKVGNGLDDGVQMGPMVSERRRAGVHRLVADAVERGAKVVLGGEPSPGPGFYYPPTVLTDVPADAELLREEPFGPVAPIAGFDSVDEALEIANGLPYGLAAYGFTESAATAEKLIAGFEAGILSINHCGGSVPQAPSGGVKDSGYGREGGHEGLSGYLVTKRVSHKLKP
jgi:succinate-semialdehyde dehydrogenase / glutarate-semialdehyde dehydrogenase